MRWLGIIVALALWPCIASAVPPGVQESLGPPPSRVAAVSANLAATGYTIPANFVGLSIENQIMINGGYLNSSQTSLVNLIKLLGSNGVLRIGGSSSDESSGAPNLTSQLATSLAGFISALGGGWTTIYGLNIEASSSGATAASQASTIASALGTANVVFQFGNEPIDGGFFTASTYSARWNTYYTAVTGAVGSVKLAAWDDGNFGQTQTAINAMTPGVSGLSYVTQHWYNGPCGTLQAAQTIISSANVFSFNGNKRWAGTTPLMLTETGPICGGSLTPSGLTDRLAAAAWYLNLAITLANSGWAGIQSHEYIGQAGWPISGSVAPNGNSYYNPLVLNADGSFQAGSIFYGLYLFSQIEGQQTVAVSVGGNANVEAIATQRVANKSNILVVNLDAANLATVTPQQSVSWSTASVLQVQGHGGCYEANPTVGGQAIGKGGSWSGVAYTISAGQSITLGPCEAALISVQ